MVGLIRWTDNFIRFRRTRGQLIVTTLGLLTGLILCSQFLCQSNHMATQVHVKARISPYPNSTVDRQKLTDEQVPWAKECKDYDPPDFTAEKVKAGPVWADPDVSHDKYKKIKFNDKDGKVNRKTFEKCPNNNKYEIKDGRPINPRGRTGLMGRGELGKWGPNHAADPIVTRWKRDAKGEEVKSSGKRILQFISIQRKDNQEWAIPGGMVDAGEKVSVTLKREFGEETLNSLEATPEEKKKIKKSVDKLFKTGHEIYRGYVDDPRNTDNAWMETIAVNFHDEKGDSVGKFKLHAGDDAEGVKWMDIAGDIKLYASHQHFIEMVTQRHGAHWKI